VYTCFMKGSAMQSVLRISENRAIEAVRSQQLFTAAVSSCKHKARQHVIVQVVFSRESTSTWNLQLFQSSGTLGDGSGILSRFFLLEVPESTTQYVCCIFLFLQLERKFASVQDFR
jgi:hypothetical protein